MTQPSPLRKAIKVLHKEYGAPFNKSDLPSMKIGFVGYLLAKEKLWT